jgi:hypothetical protein
MSSNSDKKERSLAEFIVVVALVGVMMAVFINFYMKNESQFTQAGFATLAQSFNTKVNTVHAQWMMDKQPNTVYLASINEEDKQALPVNRKGWIDVKQDQLVCETLWELVIERPISSMNFPIAAIEVHTLFDQGTNITGHEKVKNSFSECRYVLLDGSYFQYNRAKGKVSKVTKMYNSN